MPVPVAFDFATIRIVPRVERGEFINAGVILFCSEKKFLRAQVHFDEARIAALWPDYDGDLIHRHLGALSSIAEGKSDLSDIAGLPVSERFHWLVAPRSTVIQISPVHTGICESPEKALTDLFRQLVAR
jgi:hypothetical protein